MAVRLSGSEASHSYPQMEPNAPGVSPVGAATLLGRLHDGTAAMAVGVGFLRSERSTSQRAVREALEILDEALISLKRLEQDLIQSKRGPELDLLASLSQQAELLGLELDLRVTGSIERLAASQVALLRLVGREALLNVQRHSGARACRIELDVVSCPFTFRARDWGAGLTAGSQSGHGLALLGELADWLGCQLVVASQPGLGTELVVYGQGCARAGKPMMPAPSEGVIKFVSR